MTPVVVSVGGVEGEGDNEEDCKEDGMCGNCDAADSVTYPTFLYCKLGIVGSGNEVVCVGG